MLRKYFNRMKKRKEPIVKQAMIVYDILKHLVIGMVYQQVNVLMLHQKK